MSALLDNTSLITLSIPTDLRIWMEDFSTRSQTNPSDIMIRSLSRMREQETRTQAPPPGYRDEAIEDIGLSSERLQYYYDMIAEYDELDRQGRIQRYEWEDYKKVALQGVC